MTVFAKLNLQPSRKWTLGINLLGGAAVLGSYVHGLATHPILRSSVWGGVPEAIRPLYTTNMFLAAAGYLLFTGFILFRVDPAVDANESRVSPGVWNALYLGILIPSALWLPLTFEVLESPSAGLWLTIRAALATVGIASVGIIFALCRLRGTGAQGFRRLAIAGAFAFSVQTALLDALIWVAYFPV